MTEGLKSFWISIGAGAVLSIAAAPFAYTFWKSTTSERALVRSEIAELNAKLAKSNEALAELKKAASVQGIAKELEQLNGKIKNANDSLASLQKASALDGVAKQIAELDAKIRGANDAIERTNKALTDIKNTTPDAVAQALGGVKAELKGTNDALAELQKAAANTGSTAAANTQALGQIKSELKSATDALAELQKASMTTGSTAAAKTPALERSIGELAKRIDEEMATRAKLSQDIARLETEIKTQAAPKAKQEPAGNNDVVVFYVQSPDAMAKAQEAPAIPPMSVRFEKIGGLDDNGQAGMIVEKLKAITKGRTDCSVTVSGYADTLGSDKVNLDISKRRAHAIAEKLKSAFAGAHVQIKEAAWGERRLREWTPNNVAREANRRVDVSVSCKEG